MLTAPAEPAPAAPAPAPLQYDKVLLQHYSVLQSTSPYYKVPLQ